ncbi:peptide/nickel transport system ATP-binding protein [Haloplanus vescus]|uniref:Peptide/nickel transport system ATP-binding protein n=1 Tax=Haloplanus vescus TaxID=555874 RepID=A0A1H3WBL4_9EURY|nr:ABC transporter ATP-binding protein [Haloplanus vescus]SDZ84497.1 peptide/nickel transport system ATP-binding protein [Haloplanus vescus]
MTLLEVQGLKKHFPLEEGLLSGLLGDDRAVKAVDGVDFSVDAGEALTLVGESGCGKTTSVLSALRHQDPTDGLVRFKGKDIATYNKKALRSEAQLIYQDQQDTLNPTMSVGEAIAEAIRVHDIVPDDEVDARVDELLERVGIAPSDKHQRPSAFSGGQKQRIAIARALAVEPSLLVADEPVSGLDVSVQAQILNRLMDLQEEFGLGLIYVTHNLGIARKISDTIGVMYLGQIVEYGDVDDIFEDPQHPYTQALLSANPIPDPTADRERIVLQGDMPDPIDVDEHGCAFAPRCPEATEECETAEMGLEPFEDDEGHLVDCIHR